MHQLLSELHWLLQILNRYASIENVTTPSQHYEKTKCLSFQSLFGVSKCFSFAAILSAFYSSTNDVLRQRGDPLKPKALPKQVGENCG